VSFFSGSAETGDAEDELQIESELPGRGKVKLAVRGFPLIDAGNRAVGSILVIDDLTQERLLTEAWHRAATERERVKSIFGRFLAPSIVERLGDGDDPLKLGGARREITVLFADVRGFTSISEQRSPEDVVSLLNSYLACATEAILEYGGTLDKFLGDGVLALFNAPMDQDDHALAAIQTAVEIQTRLKALATDSGRELSCGVGLATGDAVVGTIGTLELMNYTAIGDVVNLASRLQSEARPGEVLLADSTYRQVAERVNVDELGPIHVKGRAAAVKVYKLRSIRDQ
jgi:adenylate cyclase